jgi:hypothetical protein
MGRNLKLVKGQHVKSTLVYGMRIFASGSLAAVEDGRVNLTDGTAGRVTMHLIEGTRRQIRRQLTESIEAFFELLDERPADPRER